jgi:hypothetical protein
MIMKKNEKMKWNKWGLNWNLGQDNINWKFRDLIELRISLINEIRGLIEEIPKFEVDSG